MKQLSQIHLKKILDQNWSFGPRKEIRAIREKSWTNNLRVKGKLETDRFSVTREKGNYINRYARGCD